MKRIYIPTTSPDDWRHYLADPGRQWRSGYSARELAECWEGAGGFPKELKELFAQADNPALRKMELLLAIPEHEVVLPGGGRPSQNDLFVLARSGDGRLAAIMVEGKVAEPFGEILGTWLKGASPGKRRRLRFLCECLGLEGELPPSIRYQLLHRTASAVLEAQRFGAGYAMMIVQSFHSEHKWFEDYQAFLSLFLVNGGVNELVELHSQKDLSLFAGWVHSRSSKQPAGDEHAHCG
jgi:hypothetical protein